MGTTEIMKVLSERSTEINHLSESENKEILLLLLNLVERLSSENEQLRHENQSFRDEINRLKGEDGKPKIRRQKPKDGDISSEKQRKSRDTPKERKPKTNRQAILIDRSQVCEIDKSLLPQDAVFKGYQPVVVQDLVIQSDNIKFEKEWYYSASLKKTFLAPLPPGYSGEFGPGIKTLIHTLKGVCLMSEPKILELLQGMKFPFRPLRFPVF